MIDVILPICNEIDNHVFIYKSMVAVGWVEVQSPMITALASLTVLEDYLMSVSLRKFVLLLQTFDLVRTGYYGTIKLLLLRRWWILACEFWMSGEQYVKNLGINPKQDDSIISWRSPCNGRLKSTVSEWYIYVCCCVKMTKWEIYFRFNRFLWWHILCILVKHLLYKKFCLDLKE